MWDKDDIEEQIESNIDFWWQKTQFAKRLLDMLHDAPTKEDFINGAVSEVRSYFDPWIQDELCSFVNNLEY